MGRKNVNEGCCPQNILLPMSPFGQCLEYKPYRQPWSNAEHKDRQLIDHHPRIVDTIDMLITNLKPPRVNMKYPISSTRKHNEPYYQETIID